MRQDRLEKALLTLNAHQRPCATDSHIGIIDPRALLIVTVFYLVLLISVSIHDLGKTIWFAVYPIVTAPLAHLRYEKVFLQSLCVLPFLILLGIFNPWLDQRTALSIGSFTVSAGWISFATIIVRGLLAMQALLLLINVAGFINLCNAMRQLCVPKVLSSQLYFLYRYIGVLLSEALAMRQAIRARGYGRRNYPLRFWGRLVGSLLLRSIDRGRRINNAMLARGFDGELWIGNSKRWDTSDSLYCFIWGTIFVALRFLDLSSMFLRIATKS